MVRGRTQLGAALLACALMAPAVGAQEYEAEPTTGAAAAEMSKTLLHLAGAAAYGGLKLGYAAGGTALGTVAWVFSGADGYVFKSIAKPAVYGDYLLTREQLFGFDFDFFGGRPAKRTISVPNAKNTLDSVEDTEDPEKVERYWARKREI